MKIVRTVRLWMKEGTSDKVYEVDLVDLESDAVARFLVNFRYGRRGASLREGAKTPAPVARDAGEQIFESVVVSKINEGYRRMDAPAGGSVGAGSAAGDPASVAYSGREAALFAKLDLCFRERWAPQQRERLLWRVGLVQLKGAFDRLEAIAQGLGGPRGASYSLVYALARCCGEKAAPLLREIALLADSVVVRDLAAFALTTSLVGAARASPHIPHPVPGDATARAFEAAIDAADGPNLLILLREAEAAQAGLASATLISLVHHQNARPAARPALLAVLPLLPARPPFVRALRRLFKYAELTDDPEIFGATARVFELADAMYRRRSVYRGQIRLHGEKGVLSVKDEMASASPRLALSDVTLLYFKRRAWRALRKRGELAQPAFARMAAGLLTAFEQGDLAKPLNWKALQFIERQWQNVDRSSGPFRNVWSVSHVLYHRAPAALFNTNNLTHRTNGPAASAVFDPAFPDLWRAEAGPALKIAAYARNEPAALFGLSVLQSFGEQLPLPSVADLTALVASPYAPVRTFAVALVRRAIDAGVVDGSLIAALLNSQLTELRELAVYTIDARTDWPWGDAALAFAVLTCAHDDVSPRADVWLVVRRPGAAFEASLVAAFVAWLAGQPATLPEATERAITAALRRLTLLWPNHDCPCAIADIERLIDHSAPPVRAAALDLLGCTQFDAGELPESFWNTGLTAAAVNVRAATVRLLARLDDNALQARGEQVRAAALDLDALVRAAARPLVTRLASIDMTFRQAMFDAVLQTAFRTEPAEGFARDVADLAGDCLGAECGALDSGTLWRLLQSKAKGAGFLGARILLSRPPPSFSVRQIARLGAHPFAQVRQWALAAFQGDEARFRAEPADAVLLLDSEWDDVCQPVLDTFSRWPADAFPAPALALMADSVDPKVQESARALMRRTLGSGEAAVVLERLLEHPAPAFHLFVTELIAADGLKSPEHFAKFVLQARVILMGIARGRTAKTRVFEILRREALAARERAAAVAPLMFDLTSSVIVKDMAPALVILRDIVQAWPDLAGPVAVTPIANRRSA
jgi:hypothetical protein